VATFTDSDPSLPASAFSATISWGDGSPNTSGGIVGCNGSFSVIACHAYEDKGTYTITVTITANCGSSATATSTETVSEAKLTGTPTSFGAIEAGLANPSPTSSLAGVGPLVQATEGVVASGVTVATFTDANPIATAGDFTATSTWGDGTPSSAGSVSGSGEFTVTGSHAYLEEGVYSPPGLNPIQVTVTD
jgi:hypothetical protein